MARAMKITRITVTHYSWEIQDLGYEERLGFDHTGRRYVRRFE